MREIKGQLRDSGWFDQVPQPDLEGFAVWGWGNSIQV